MRFTPLDQNVLNGPRRAQVVGFVEGGNQLSLEQSGKIIPELIFVKINFKHLSLLSK
jgi:hypothetical protein